MDFPGRFAIERHAKQCYACDKEVSSALHLRQMAGDLKRVKAPMDFEVALLARIQKEKSRRRLWKFQDLWRYGLEGFSWKIAAITTAVTILCIGAAAYIHYGPGFGRSNVPLADLVTSPLEPPDGGPVVNAAAGNQGNPDLPLSRMPDLNFANFSRFAQNSLATPYADPGDFDYFELPVPVAGDQQLILQVPKTIRLRYQQLPREYFIRHVSH
jgi:hypothetical protein